MDRVRPFACRRNEDHEIFRHTRLCNVLLSRDSCRRCSRTRKRRRKTRDALDSTPVPAHTDRRKDVSKSRWSSVERKRKLTHIQILKNSMHATWGKSIQGVAGFATNLCIILKKRGAKRRFRPTVVAPDTSLRSHESLADSVERKAGVRFGSSAKCIPRTRLKGYEGGSVRRDATTRREPRKASTNFAWFAR